MSTDTGDTVTDPCRWCGRNDGSHHLTKNDCILGHRDHAERYIGYACRRHYHWIDRTLVQIEELAALFDEVLLPGPGTGERSATRVGSPAPGRLEVMALTDKRAKTPIDLDDEDDVPDLIGTLHSWGRIVAEEREVDEPDGTATAAIRILRRERHWIAQQDWLDDYVTELGALHRAAARGAGTTMWPEPIGKCPNDATPLYNTIGADVVTCRKCKASWTGVHLVRLRLIHEQEAS